MALIGLDKSTAPIFREAVPARCQSFGSTDKRFLRPLVPRELRSHCTQAASLDELPLSSYDFPQIPRNFRELPALDAAVRSAVTHISEAPFIQLQQDNETTHHAVNVPSLLSAQMRDGLSEFFRESDADMVMLVQPLDALDTGRSTRQVDADGNVMTGIINSSRRRRLESFATFLRRGGLRADLSGSVGDCCDDDSKMTSQVVAFPRGRYAKYSQNRHRSSQTREEMCKYYGVIIQSKKKGDAGCYVLKTVDSAVGDCTCIHWTLTRMRHRHGIFDQLSSAWLASS